MDHRAHLNKKSGSMKYQYAKVDESFVPGLEDEATNAKHLIAEPNPGNVSVDSELRFSKENPWKHLEIEDFFYGMDFDLKKNCGGLDCITQGQNELELGVLDGLLDEVDEIDDFHAANDISGACEDFPLDIELADKISDPNHAASGRSCVGNSSSESQSPRFSESGNGILGLSEPFAAKVIQSECKNVSTDNKLLRYGSHDLAVEKINYQTSFGYAGFTATLDLNFDELDDAWLLGGMSCDENEKTTIQTCRVDTPVGQRRARRPAKRYAKEFSVLELEHEPETKHGMNANSTNECIMSMSRNEIHNAKEESLGETITHETLEVEDDERLSDLKSKCVTRRRKISSFVPKDKRVKLGSHNEHHHHLRSPESTPSYEPAARTSQEPCSYRPRRGRPRKLPSVSAFGSEDEKSESDSEDYRVKSSKKSGDRRKHQRMWTLSEVTKLMDGIAQYGTGRWTDIKKLSFSSSAHRTPIDLRDKWRNLLRASSANKQKLKHNKEDGKTLKHGMGTLPKTVVRRIRELAILHPYPRFSPGGRYIRRKSN